MAGAIWAIAASLTPPPKLQVKQPVIALPPDAYQGDPNLQGAIQKQLQQQADGTQQQQSNSQSNTATGNLLQPVGGINQ